MKAISVRAPWWWAILHAGKNIENRDWYTPHRGPILIHASARFVAWEVEDDLDFIRRTAAEAGTHLPSVPTPRHVRSFGGHIVGRANLVACVRKSDSPWFFGPRGFVLADAEMSNLATSEPAEGRFQDAP